ncbi:unnamed protein product [Lactuca saligna]|uniref:Uncharacterized protein n=1 Tax=Lactuca saligna TaxID=75948 RepID=A0AA35ZV66_LACSI|nr:unnamed protein product [Lactuca saligna]
MFRCVPVASKILEEYKKIPSSGARTSSPEMRLTIDEADKVKKGAPPKRRKQHDRKRKTPTPSASEGSESDTQSDVWSMEDNPVRHEEDHNEDVRNEEETLHNTLNTSNPEFLHNNKPLFLSPSHCSLIQQFLSPPLPYLLFHPTYLIQGL